MSKSKILLPQIITSFEVGLPQLLESL